VLVVPTRERPSLFPGVTVGNAFITTYLTKPKMTRHPHTHWPASFEVLERLAESLRPWGELIVCADELTEIPTGFEHVTIRPVTQPVENVYFERWDIIRDTLAERTDLDLVYAVDARDVIAIKDPWDYIQPGTLYTCTEPATLIVGRGRRWFGQPLGRSGFINDRGYHSSPLVREWIRRHYRFTALNAGVSAADRDTLLRFATRMAEARLEDHMREDYTDMALFNMIAHQEFKAVGSEEFIGAKCHLEEDAPKARVLHVP